MSCACRALHWRTRPELVPKEDSSGRSRFPIHPIGELGIYAEMRALARQQERTKASADRPLAVKRQTIGGNTSLRREDLPEDSGAAVLLDLDLSLFVVERTGFIGYRPGAIATFVWLDSVGRPLGGRKGLIINGDVSHWSRKATPFSLGASLNICRERRPDGRVSIQEHDRGRERSA